MNSQKSSSKTVSPLRGFVYVTLALVGIFGPIMAHNYQKNTSAVQATQEQRARAEQERQEGVVYDHIQDLAYDYIQSHTRYEDVYWLIGNEDHGTFIEKITAFETRTKDLLAQTVNISPLAREIYETQGDFYVSIFSNGSTQRLFRPQPGDDVTAMLARYASRAEVVIVPKLQMQQYGDQFPSPLYYRQQWHALSVVGIEMPDNWHTAIMLHEMGHKLRHDRGAESATAPSGSNAWIWEEIEMHALEHKVLDTISEGMLSGLYESIRNRADDPTDPERVILAATKDDLAHYDTITQITDSGPEMANIYVSQFFLGLGIYTVNASGGSRADMIQVYRRQTTRSNSKLHAPVEYVEHEVL